MATCFLLAGRDAAAGGTLLALLGCLGLVLPPRERMARLPWRLRTLPRHWDAAPVLASLLSAPGYGLEWFYGDNLNDETVHLVCGLLAGAVPAGLLHTDGRLRPAGRLLTAGAAAGLPLACGWEAFEWATGLIGDGFDTATDIALTAGGAMLGAWLVGWWPPRPLVSEGWAAARNGADAPAGGYGRLPFSQSR